EQRRVNPDLQRVLFAEDRDLLLDWLRERELLHVDRDLGWMMVHAGLAPKWTTQLAEKHAREVEAGLRDDGRGKLLCNMYGDQPAARDHQRAHAPALVLAQGPDRVRGKGRTGHPAGWPVPLVQRARPRRARPEDRLRPLVHPRPVHRPRCARY